jgi:DNA-binding response OmpR family regulator
LPWYRRIGTTASRHKEGQLMAHRRRRSRILVVDDEPDFTDLLATFLEEEGYCIDRAYDGEQALRILQSDDVPDLVLSDVMMPKLSGTELVAAARRLHPGEKLPFVLLTAGPDPGLHADHAYFMAKPLDLDQLLDRVKLLMDTPRQHVDLKPSAQV